MAANLLAEAKHLEQALDRVLKRLMFGEKQQIAFLDEFVSMFRHIEKPLEILKYMEAYGDSTRKKVCRSLIPKVTGGQGLSAGMDGWFDPMIVEACRVGESAGRLDDVLAKTISAMKVQRSGMSSSLSLMIYPLMLTVGFSFLAIRLKQGTISTILQFRNVTYDTLTPQLKFVHTFATVMENYWYVMVLATVSTLSVVAWLLRNQVGPLRDALDQLPVFKQYRLLTGAKFMRMYAILKEINVTESRIFRTLARYSTPYYRSHLNKMSRKLEAGASQSIVSVLDTGLISNSNIARLSLLSGYKNDYSVVLADCAVVVVDSTAANVKLAARIFAGVWMLVVGAALATTILGVLNINQVVGV